MKDTVTYYTKTDLKKRGWNEQLIERFLGLPDRTRINMKYKSGPPVCLYEARRVQTAEQQQEFVERQQARAERRAAARRAVATKEAQMYEWLAGIEISIPTMDWETLTREAIEHFNHRRFATGEILASSNSDEDFLNRIRVNFLRHELTDYEYLLAAKWGKVGAADAYFEIKRKVLDAIADAYPRLSPECAKQADKLRSQWLCSYLREWH